MDVSHLAASVSRAKTIGHERGLALDDGVLAYLAKCADVNGKWWALLGEASPKPIGGQDLGGSTQATVSDESAQSAAGLEPVMEGDEAEEPSSSGSQIVSTSDAELNEGLQHPTLQADSRDALDGETMGNTDGGRAVAMQEQAEAHSAATTETLAETQKKDRPSDGVPDQQQSAVPATAEVPAAQAEGSAEQDNADAKADTEAASAEISTAEVTATQVADEQAQAPGASMDANLSKGGDRPHAADNAKDADGSDAAADQAARGSTGSEPAIGAPLREVEPERATASRASLPDPNMTAMTTAVDDNDGFVGPLHDVDKAAGEASLTEAQSAQRAVANAVEQLARLLVLEASKEWQPAVTVAGLQLAMERCFREQQQALREEQDDRVDRVTAKLRQVLAFRAKRTTVQEMNRLYDQVVYFVCMAGCMTDALLDAEFEADVRAAVESVFPFSMLAQYLTLGATEREQQLHELPYIALGICLYHQMKGVSPCSALMPALQRSSESTATVAAGKAEMAATHLALQGYTGALAKQKLRPGSLAAAEGQGLLSQALFLFQAHTHLGQIVMAVTSALEVMDDIRAQIEAAVVGVDAALKDARAVPKQIVMPIFHKMGQLYETLVVEQRSTAVNQALMERLLELKTAMRPGLTPLALKAAALNPEISLLPGTGSMDHVQRPGSPAPARCLRMHQEDVVDVQLPPLAFGGADVVVLARHDGLPAVYNPQLGYVLYPEQGGSIYGFAAEASLLEFMARPADYVAAATAALWRHPHVIPTFGVMDSSLPRFVPDVVDLGLQTMKCSCATQTPTHFIERHIDHKYEWNEWALRRAALALANLQRKVTKSAQTADSTFRRENETQYWQPRVNATQTTVNKGQAMPKKLRYIAGLRGDPVTLRMKVVSLELDCGQSHQL